MDPKIAKFLLSLLAQVSVSGADPDIVETAQLVASARTSLLELAASDGDDVPLQT